MSISFIDIPASSNNTCELPCRLWYNYTDSPVSKVGSTSDYMKINYDGAGSNVMYNSTVFNVETYYAISIYVGGIHRFGSPPTRPPLEMVIKHKSPQNGSELYICIPIYSSGGASANPMDTLITSYFPAKNVSTVSVSNFNLNYIIPKSTFFIHTGAYHGSTNSKAIYVVFPKNSLNISDATIKLMTETMSAYTRILAQNRTLLQNIKGTTVNGFSGDGQIYIDCQPTDSSGEIVMKETIVPTNFYKFNMSGLIYFIIVVISCILLIVLYQKIKDFFTLKNI
jgi:hypothetical protein